MITKNNIFIKLFIILFLPIILYANISGIVFQDIPVNPQTLNTYGIKDSNELGVKGITVTAYPENISTTTDSNGSWSLNTSKDSRIEFSNFPSYLKESSHGGINNSSVQFVTNNSTNITFGLHDPNDYSHTKNPLYVNNIQQNGTHIGSNLLALHSVHYQSKGLNSDYEDNNSNQGIGESPLLNINNSLYLDDIGSVWGKAYQKNKKRLFVSSMLQRHIGLANTLSDIYVIDYSSGKQDQLLGHFSLQGKTPNNLGAIPIDLGTINREISSGSNYQLSDNPLIPNIDFDAYSKVGKVSYGGIDVDHNENTLWLINLKQKGLISIDVSGDFNSLSTAKTNQYLIESLPNVPVCTNGQLRPWGLKIHKDKGYIGLICDGSTTNPDNPYRSRNDLHAYIISFNLNTPQLGFTNILNFKLNYPRQLRRWYAWEDNYVDTTRAYNGQIYSQPILSDIEFDEKGNMYLAFMDRYATQIRTGNLKAILNTTELEATHVYGDILKACNNNGVYEIEGTGNCFQTLRANKISLGISEFFNDIDGGRNRESSLGSLALLVGSNQILNTMVDPHPEETSGTNNNTYWFTQGVHTLSTTNGSIENWYSHAYTLGNGLNAKGNGLGDIELITKAAPIEIGDRIWFDSNSNGIQDSDEEGIEDVNISLLCDNTIVAIAQTNNMGTYIFSNDPHTTSTKSHIYNISHLTENNNNNCYIHIPNTNGKNKQVQLNTKIMTKNNLGEGINKNLNDSNGIIDNNHSKIILLPSDIPIAGYNNHSLDIGFQPQILYTLGDTVWLDSNKDGLFDSNESTVSGVTVSLFTNASCTGTAT
ncbi:MAG: Unknown protein, partial [uncultured Sulfurovum sp.]